MHLGTWGKYNDSHIKIARTVQLVGHKVTYEGNSLATQQQQQNIYKHAKQAIKCRKVYLRESDYFGKMGVYITVSGLAMRT